MTQGVKKVESGKHGPEREVVVLMSDMVQYSQVTAHMSPEEVRDFVVDYHKNIQAIIGAEENQPVEIEPQAGDGALVIFDKLPGEGREGVCTRALKAALQMAHAIEEKKIPPTRMGLYLGDIIEAQLGKRQVKFGSSFAVATRLEELCDYFGTSLLMDREIARYQTDETKYLVSIGKVTLQSFSHPVHVFTVYKPGLNNVPAGTSEHLLLEFIRMKNNAMENFCGNSPMGITPDFPAVREMLIEAQDFFVDKTGREDRSLERILEYIRETPVPDKDFLTHGMKLAEKKRGYLGARLFRLSRELLKAMNHEFYHALVVDTGWEKHFKLEWRKKDETIITIHDRPDGVYFLDTGEVVTLNDEGEQIAILTAGTIFGEMAYFSEEKLRTATVIANSDVVIRRISSEDFEKLPVIMRIFERIAMDRR